MAKSNLNNNAVWRTNNKYANQALSSAAKKSSKVNAVVTAARKKENEQARKSGSPQQYSSNEAYLSQKGTSGKGGGTTKAASSSYTESQQKKQEKAQKILRSTTYSRLDPNSERAKSIREQAGYTAENDTTQSEKSENALSKVQYRRDTTGEQVDTGRSPAKRGTASLHAAATEEQKDTIAYQLNQLKAASENAGSRVSEAVSRRVQQDYVDQINKKAREQMREKYGDEYDFSGYEAVSYDASAGDYRLNYTGQQEYDAAAKRWTYRGGALLGETDTIGTGYGNISGGQINEVGVQLGAINNKYRQAQYAAENPQDYGGAGERLMNAASSIGTGFVAPFAQAGSLMNALGDENNALRQVRQDAEGNYLLTDEQMRNYEYNRTHGQLTGDILKDTEVADSWARELYTQISEDQAKALDGLNGWKKFLGETGISIANSAVAVLAGTLVGGPAGSAVSLGLMGLQAGAQKSYEKQQEGATAEQALVAGLISGGIEVATEKVPLDNLFSKKTPLKKFWSQIATEAAEEGASYVANAIADRLQGDDEAHIELDELALNALGGAISGAVFGGVAAGADKISSYAAERNTRQELGAVEEYVDGKLAERMQELMAQYGEDVIGDAAERITTQTEDCLSAAAVAARRSVSGSENVSGRVQTAVRKSTEASSIYPALEKEGRNAYAALSAGERTDRTSMQEFATMYRAGLESRGTPYNAVKDAFSVESLRAPEEAYYAGQRDAAALDEVSDEDAAFIQAATDALGVTVQVEELPKGINGYIQGDVLHVSKDARAVETVAHEITHRMQTEAAEEYREFQGYIAEGMADVSGAIQDKIAQYAKHGITLGESEAMDEITAEYAQKLASDSAAIREYVRTNGVQRSKGMWERIKSAFRKLIDRLTGQAKEDVVRQMNRAERLWIRAFDRASQQAKKKAAKNGGKMRFSIQTLANGKKIVVIDSGQELFEGVDPKDYRKVARKFIRETYKGKTLPLGERDLARITKKLGGEYTYPSTRIGVNEYKAKMRAAAELHNLLEAAEYSHWAEDKKNHLEATLGFDYYKVTFEVDGRRFTGLLNIANSQRGRILYDITKIEESPLPDKPPTGLAEISSRIGVRDSSESRVTEVGGEVKKKYSVESQEEKISRLERELARARAELKRTPAEEVTFETVDDRTSATGETVVRTSRSVATKDRKAIGKMAADLRKEYNSGYNKDDLTDDIQALYDILSLNPETRESEEVRGLALDIAEEILGHSQTVNDEMSRQYEGLRDELRKTAVTVSEADRGDFADGWAKFRKEARGLVKFSGEGIPVDVKYAELSERYPELFPEDVTHPADQAQQLLAVAQELKPFHENVYERDWDDVSKLIADDILARFEETPDRKTFADRAADKLENERDRNARRLEQERERSEQRRKDAADRAQAAMKKLEARKDREIQGLQERIQRQKERQKQLREQRERTKAKHRAVELVNKLAVTYAKPSKEKYVPELYRKAVGELLRGLDLESRKGWDENWKLTQVTQENAGELTPTSTTERWRNLLEMVKAIDSQKEVFAEGTEDVVLGFDPSLVTLDPNLVENIQQIVRIDRNINEYTEEQLELLHNTVAALNKSIESYAQTSKAFQQAKITDLGDRLIRDNQKNGLVKEKTKAGKMMVDNLQAWDFLHRLGDVGDQVFEALHDGMDEKIRMTRKYQELTQKAVRGTSGSRRQREKRMNEVRKWMQEKPKAYQLDSGDTVNLTTAQIMSLYMYSRDEQAMKHLLRSGIKEGKTTVKNKQTEGVRAHELTENDLRRLLDTLTSEQRRVAEDLHDVMNQMADDGNVVTVRRYGYQMFTNKDYFPIRSYGVRETQTDAQKRLDINGVNHMGMLKARQQFASSAIELNSFFDLYYQHFDEMTQFIAFGEAMEDISRIYNYKQRKFSEKDAMQMLSRTVQNTTVQDAIRQRFGGKAGTEYFEKLMVDLNGGIDYKGDGTEFLNKLLRNFKAAAVGANLSVVVQQPFSYVRAAAIYNPLRMLRALPAGVRSAFEKGAFERAVEHSPIAWWKQQGHYELDISRSMQEELLGTSKLQSAMDSALFGLAGRADSLAWGQLWAATEYEVQSEYKKADRREKTTRSREEYKRLFDSEEYWDRCNRKFRQMIARTQVVDSTLHRSGLMRSGDTMMKSLTSFMSEPTKSFNLLSTTIWDAVHHPSAKNTAMIGRTAVAFTASALMTTAAKSVIAALRDDDEDKDQRDARWRILEHWLGLTYDETFGREEFNTASLVFNSNLMGEMNPITMIPLVNEIWGLLEYDEDKGGVTASTWGHSYKTDSLFQNIGRLMSAAESVMDAVNNPGMTDETLFVSLSNLIGRTADLAGVPGTSLKRDLGAIANSVLRALDENPQLKKLEEKAGIQMDFAKIRYDLKTLCKNFNDENKSDWITMAFQYEKDGREDIAQDIYERLLGSGVSEEKIDEQLKKLQLASADYKREERHAKTNMDAAAKDRAGWIKLSASEKEAVMTGEDSIINQVAADTAKQALNMETDTPKWMQNYYALEDEETKADLLVMYGTANVEKKNGSQLDAYLWLEASGYAQETGLSKKEKQALWDAYGGWKTSYADYKAEFQAEYGDSKKTVQKMHDQLHGNGGDAFRETVTAESIAAAMDPEKTSEETEISTKSGSSAFGRAKSGRSGGRSSGGNGVAAASDWEGAAHINVGSSSQEVAAALSRSSEYAKLGSKGQETARKYAAEIASGSASSSYIADAVNARSRYGVTSANYVALSSKYGKQALQSARAKSAGEKGILPEYLDSYQKLKDYESTDGNNNGWFDMTETKGWLSTQSLTTAQKAALFDVWFPKATYNPYR